MLAGLYSLASLSFAQSSPPSSLSAHKTENIRIDGILDEEVWKTAQIASQFTQNFPNDTTQAQSQTEVRVAYSDEFLYVAAICRGNEHDDYVVTSLKRDYSWGLNDNFTINIDPFGDGLNGFFFTLSPVGAQLEGLIFEGDRTAANWDNKWYGEVDNKQEGVWVCEMAIPFKTLRFPANKKKWKVNFARNDAKRNETSTWVRVPINFSTASLAFSADLVFEDNIPKAGANISLIPYTAGSISKDYLANTPTKSKITVGGDAKIAVTPSLNLDLTIICLLLCI